MLDALDLLELDLGAGPPARVPRRLPGVKTTWSHSAQALAERCPAAFKRRYLDRVQDPPTAAMTAGAAFGAALAQLYTAALLGHRWTAEHAAELAAATYDERRAGPIGPRHAERRAQAIDASRAYARERAPEILNAHGDQLRAVERRFTLRLAGVDAAGRPAVCEWVIEGYLDLEADREVRDFKLVGQAHPTQADADASLQAGLYLLARAAEGYRAERFVFDSTRRAHGPRSRTARFADTATTRGTPALAALQRRVAATTLLVALCDDADTWPFAPAAWWCAPGQCATWGECAGGGLAAGHAPAEPQRLADAA